MQSRSCICEARLPQGHKDSQMSQGESPRSNEPAPGKAPNTPVVAANKKPRRTWRRFFWVLGWTAAIVLFVGAAGLAGAEYWTSRPSFCGSCHVMDPYYESWSHDTHGAKIGALCVDCHYAPGE